MVFSLLLYSSSVCSLVFIGIILRLAEGPPHAFVFCKVDARVAMPLCSRSPDLSKCRSVQVKKRQ
ncbi:uncharacterized protein K489DRAFT_73578 [Dissoconium aciculare CBS 342.82]|uniref:Uncharacterized protein n=1 Tax=Dissoconium aciculare CBS 342.82 TaxID=1314786 RepID=A0A6J3LTG8_9PEZI|nr:uncharacterized protein K489DRAFT_73578 [Dissoconium aciculare CBS 342.82]KAF1819081.1 hypothetical protein K489DRAFT_73578 [Dissoconium aciculare CBS 342.82]